MNIVPSGLVGIGLDYTVTPSARLHVSTVTDATKGILVKGVASQSANMLEIQDSAGTALSYFDSLGQLNLRGLNQLVLWNSTNNRYIGLYCDDLITGSFSISLPPDNGLSGQLLATTGSGATYWEDPTSGPTGPTGPQGFQGGTGAQGAQGLQGAKPAIVPVQTFMGEEYVELLCVEMPEVYFEDFLTIKAGNQGHQSHTVLGEIDPLFLQVCEEGTIKATAAMPSHPANVGAKVQGPVVEVSVEGASIQSREVDIIVRLSGIRAGMVGRRFAKRTYQQMVKNNNFWSQW